MSEALQWLLGVCAGLITLVTAGREGEEPVLARHEGGKAARRAAR